MAPGSIIVAALLVAQVHTSTLSDTPCEDPEDARWACYQGQELYHNAVMWEGRALQMYIRLRGCDEKLSIIHEPIPSPEPDVIMSPWFWGAAAILLVGGGAYLGYTLSPARL